MRYISEVIGYPDGVVPGLWYKTPSAGNYIRLVVYDTDTNTHETFYVGEENIANVIGVAPCAVVSYSPKTIQIHRYIKSIGTVPLSCAGWAMTDTCILHRPDRVQHRSVFGRFRLTIEMGEDKVTFLGPSNSVAMRRRGNRIDVYNIYDFLGDMCRDCELNLMSYNTIRFYTRDGEDSCMTVLELEHSKEADRYFSKMYLDVMKR